MTCSDVIVSAKAAAGVPLRTWKPMQECYTGRKLSIGTCDCECDYNCDCDCDCLNLLTTHWNHIWLAQLGCPGHATWHVPRWFCQYTPPTQKGSLGKTWIVTHKELLLYQIHGAWGTVDAYTIWWDVWMVGFITATLCLILTKCLAWEELFSNAQAQPPWEKFR